MVQVEEDNKVGSRRDSVHCLSVYSRNTRLKSVVVLLDCFLASAYTPVHNMQYKTAFLGQKVLAIVRVTQLGRLLWVHMCVFFCVSLLACY